MYIPEGFAQVNLIFTGDYIPNGAQCTFGVEVNSVGATPQTVADVVEGLFSAADGLRDATMALVDITTIRVKFGPNDTGPFVESAVNITGSSVTTESMPNCTYLLHKITNLGGRRNRGRMYWPGLPLSETSATGQIGNDARNGIDADFVTILAGLETADLPMVLLHSNDPSIPVTVTAVTCDSRAATQRRRLRD